MDNELHYEGKEASMKTKKGNGSLHRMNNVQIQTYERG